MGLPGRTVVLTDFRTVLSERAPADMVHCKMMNSILRIAAWLLLLAVCLMTLGPVSLRPRLNSFPVDFERLGAWACVGGAFVLAYPGRRLRLLLLLVSAAGLLEVAQHLVLGRHGELRHFLFKAAGATLGIVIGHATNWLLGKRSLEWASYGTRRGPKSPSDAGS